MASLVERAQKVFTNYLQENGKHVTKPRKWLVREVFRLKPEHFDAEELLDKLRENGHPRGDGEEISISRATLYRTLDLMVKAGLLYKNTIDGGSARYEVKLGRQHHHHIVCENCDKIVEFVDWGHEHIVRQAAACRGWQFHDSELVVYGLCPSCRKKAEQSSEEAPAGTAEAR